MKKRIIVLAFIFIVFICLLMAACAPLSTDSGISGHVVTGPVLPVTTGDAPDTKPFTAAVIIVRDQKGGKEIARQHADAQGAFKIFLPAGAWYIDPQNDAGTVFPFAPPQTVEVQKGAFTDVTILFDTGIR